MRLNRFVNYLTVEKINWTNGYQHSFEENKIKSRSVYRKRINFIRKNLNDSYRIIHVDESGEDRELYEYNP